MASVPEIVYPVIAFVVGFRLSNLVVVMGEFEVNATGVDIDWEFLENRSSHSRALDVPSWPSLAPGRFPNRFILLCFLPKSKVLNIFLFGLSCFPCESPFSLSQGLKVSNF